MSDLSNQLHQFAEHPRNVAINFRIAESYEKENQIGTAIGFYLRAAEYGFELPESVWLRKLVYIALCRIGLCFEKQGGRDTSVENAYLQAVAWSPSNPEAYFLLARFYERRKQWQQGYSMAATGLVFADNAYTDYFVEYLGRQSLLFERSVCAWWIGRADEARQLSYALLTSFSFDEVHRKALAQNLVNLGLELMDDVHPLEPLITLYRKYFGAKATTIVDIGSRDGDDARLLATQLNAENIIAIDANPVAAAAIRDVYPEMRVVECAVGCEAGQASFMQVVSDDANEMGSSSLSAYKLENKTNVENITVNVQRMDEILRQQGLAAATIDLVKIDVEGFTLQTLWGFGDRLKDVRMFHVETEQRKTHDEHYDSKKVSEFLRMQGFALVDVSHEWGWLIQDQIWVNRRKAIKHHEQFRNEPW